MNKQADNGSTNWKAFSCPREKNALDIPFIQTYHHRIKEYSGTMTQANLTKR
jgi:hypothetical protein